MKVPSSTSGDKSGPLSSEPTNLPAVVETKRLTAAPDNSNEPLRVLVVDDERGHAEAVAESLERVGYACVIANSGSAGARKIEREDFDVILTDLRMGDMDGLAILRKAKHDLPDAEVVVITGHGDIKTAVEAIKQGAASYLTKPVDMAELRAIVDRAAQRLAAGSCQPGAETAAGRKIRLRRSGRQQRPHA